MSLQSLVSEAAGGDQLLTERVLAAAERDGVRDLGSAALVKEEEWVHYGLPRIRARALVGQLAAARAAPPALQPAPEDSAWLADWRAPLTEVPGPADTLALLRASLAERHGLLGMEARLLTAIEARALSLDLPCPPLFWELQREVTRQQHGGLLAALDLPGDLVSEARKREALVRSARLFAALDAFQRQLVAWRSTWSKRLGDPHQLLAGLAAAASGAPATLPPPDTGPVLDAYTTLLLAVQKAFAGTTRPVARALAAEAVRWRGWLARPDLHDALGAEDAPSALRALGISLRPEDARQEAELGTWLVNVWDLPALTGAAQAERLVQLAELGSQLPFAGWAEPPRPRAVRGMA